MIRPTDKSSLFSLTAMLLGTVLQLIGKFAVALVLLLVPTLTKALLDDGDALLGVAVLLSAAASLIVAAIVQFFMRRRLVTTVAVLFHAALPAFLTTSLNLLSRPGNFTTPSVWSNIIACTLLAMAGGWLLSLPALAARRREQLWDDSIDG